MNRGWLVTRDEAKVDLLGGKFNDRPSALYAKPIYIKTGGYLHKCVHLSTWNALNDVDGQQRRKDFQRPKVSFCCSLRYV